jgi:RNA-binding protein YlmH
MAGETLKDFLVSLGWDFSQEAHLRFVGAMRAAELQARLLGDAIEEMARRVLTAVSNTAAGFDRLFFVADRNKTSVETIKALGQAAELSGSSVGEMNALLETMARNIRENGGA